MPKEFMARGTVSGCEGVAPRIKINMARASPLAPLTNFTSSLNIGTEYAHK